MPEPPRRSGRTRKVNTKYTNDGWSKETLRLLRESSESSNPTSTDSDEEQLESDKEFGEQELQAADAGPDPDEDNLSVASGSSKSSQVSTPGEEEDDISMADSGEEEGGGVGARKGGGTAWKQTRWKQPDHLHARGIPTVDRTKAIKNGAWQSVFGPQVDDLKPMVEAKARWLHNVRDLTLPSWATMAEARRNEWSKQSQQVDTENTNQSIPLSTRDIQKVIQISLDEAKERQFLVSGPDHTIVLGPWTKQKAYNLPHLQAKDIASEWRIKQDDSTRSYHSGWSLNVGEKPQSMAWALHQDKDQYLAIACRSTPQQRASVPKVEGDTSPAFAPSAKYPLAIQIWKFTVLSNSTSDGVKGQTMDQQQPPQLAQILAWNFGDVKQMAWAPQPKHTLPSDSHKQLGLLTVITSDGCARIIHVPKPDPDIPKPTCLEILSSAITLPPTTHELFTCFTFASPTDLILGTSSGTIQIFNLSTANQKPYFTHRLHHTYLNSICALTSTTPTNQYSHFLASTSASGAIQLTDLRSPTQDTHSIPRARIPTRNLTCNAHTRTFITTIDSSGNTEAKGNAQTIMVGHNLRHFYSSMALSKFPEGSGTATSVAGSTLHPYVLMGNSGGTVWAQNVARRVLPVGRPGGKSEAGAWVQKVVEYLWIPTPESATSTSTSPSTTATADKQSIYHGSPVRAGTSRMHHGFRPEKIDLSNAGSKKRKAPMNDEGNAVQVVFEEEQAVSCIVWNENLGVAGWCAVAWGSGVVLVCDLGHDAK